MKQSSGCIASFDKLLLAGTIMAAATMAPANGQEKDPPPPPELPADAKIGPAKFDVPFSDPGNETAKEMAATLGISVGQATSSLRKSQNAARFAARMQQLHPDRFAAVGITYDGGNARVVLYRTGDGDLDTAGAASPDLGNVQQQAVRFSRGQIKKRGKDLAGELAALGITADIAVSASEGQIRILARDPSAVEAAIASGDLELADYVSVEQFDGIQTTATEAIGAGYAANTDTHNCTVGFTVRRTTTTERGTTTAGHCGNRLRVSNSYSTSYSSSGQAGTSYVDQWIRPTNADYGIDLQWHTPNSPAYAIPQIWTGTSWVGVTGGQDDLEGTFVCKYGRTTGRTCGNVDKYEYYSSGYYGYFPRVNRPSDAAPLNDSGDSGGPVYSGSLAVGWVHGKDSSGNMYYTPLRNLVQNSTGIAVLTIYP